MASRWIWDKNYNLSCFDLAEGETLTSSLHLRAGLQWNVLYRLSYDPSSIFSGILQKLQRIHDKTGYHSMRRRRSFLILFR
jgi:hypothetical protein